MALSFSKPVNKADIAEIDVILPGKIWRIRGRNNDDLIIKTEGRSDAHSSSDISHVNKIVRSVIERDAGVIGKLMIGSEIEAIRSFCEDVKNKKNYEGLEESFDQPFFKMVVARDLVNLDDIKKNEPAKGRQIALLITKALEGEGGYETLGRIFAADLFNDNKDRFDNDQVNWAGGNGSVIKNTGNVMFAVAGIGNQKLCPVGMDNYDAQSEFRRLNISNANMQGQVGRWTGHLLLDENRNELDDFINRIIKSLYKLLRTGGSEPKIPDTEAESRMQIGVKQGISLIKYKLFRAKNMPINIAERMRILRWPRFDPAKLINPVQPPNNFLANYQQTSRWSITKNEKKGTVDKLWVTMGDAPEAFDKIIHALVCFKMSRKTGAIQDAELALSRVEESLRVDGLDPAANRYPTTVELMTLVKNRSFLVQRTLPDTFKNFLLAIPPSIRNDIFAANPKTQGIAVAETVENIKAFLNNNGVPVQPPE